ncbi:MAG: hypothetical protein HW413_2585 [Thermoleophilia bacterium]|nr:hypothetical protein [Thermoleophilia bacterium]
MPFGGHDSESREELRRLLRSEDGGRLVEDEHPRAAKHGLDDLDTLLFADGELPDARVRIDGHVERLRDLPDLAQARSPAEPEARRVRSQHEVLRNRQRFDEPKVLMNHSDAGVKRVTGRMEVHWLPVEVDLTPVGPVEPCEDVRQGRLARAVFPEQRVHFPNGHLEADIVVRQDSRKTLGDTGHAHGRNRRGAG